MAKDQSQDLFAEKLLRDNGQLAKDIERLQRALDDRNEDSRLQRLQALQYRVFASIEVAGIWAIALLLYLGH